MWLLEYNFSVAVAVGFIALAGVAAETGVVMIVYLDEAWKHLKEHAERTLTFTDLRHAIVEGAVQRVRPKMMTVSTTIIGLMPIMWSAGTGADTMKRIAAPMIGGLVSSTLLTLLIIPAVYYLWRSTELQGDSEVGTTPKGRRTIWLCGAIVTAAIAVFAIQQKDGTRDISSLNASILTTSVGEYSITVFGEQARLESGTTPIKVEVRQTTSGQLVPVDSVALSVRMDMPGMQMKADALLTPSEMPGVFTGTIKPGMAGEWTAGITVSGEEGPASNSMTVEVEQ